MFLFPNPTFCENRRYLFRTRFLIIDTYRIWGACLLRKPHPSFLIVKKNNKMRIEVKKDDVFGINLCLYFDSEIEREFFFMKNRKLHTFSVAHEVVSKDELIPYVFVSEEKLKQTQKALIDFSDMGDFIHTSIEVPNIGDKVEVMVGGSTNIVEGVVIGIKEVKNVTATTTKIETTIAVELASPNSGVIETKFYIKKT